MPILLETKDSHCLAASQARLDHALMRDAVGDIAASETVVRRLCRVGRRILM